MEIDYKKLLEQEPEFAEFAKQVTFKVFTETQPQIIGMIHAMYAGGMPIDVVVQTFKMMMLFGGDDDQKRGGHGRARTNR